MKITFKNVVAHLPHWTPAGLMLIVLATMGADDLGADALMPVLYYVGNTLGGWLQSRQAMRALEQKLNVHVDNHDVHFHRRASDEKDTP